MKTQEAYYIYQAQLANDANYQSTVLWVLFTVFVIAPLIIFFVWVTVALLAIPKCPKCGSRKTLPGLQVTKNKGTSTTRKVHICSKCGHEF